MKARRSRIPGDKDLSPYTECEVPFFRAWSDLRHSTSSASRQCFAHSQCQRSLSENRSARLCPFRSSHRTQEIRSSAARYSGREPSETEPL